MADSFVTRRIQSKTRFHPEKDDLSEKTRSVIVHLRESHRMEKRLIFRTHMVESSWPSQAANTSL